MHQHHPFEVSFIKLIIVFLLFVLFGLQVLDVHLREGVAVELLILEELVPLLLRSVGAVSVPVVLALKAISVSP